MPALGGQSRWRPGWRVDVVWWFVTPLFTKTIARVAIVLVLVLAALLSGIAIDQANLESFIAPRPQIARLPWPVQLLGLLLIADLLAYLTHRLLHAGALWRIHAVHHS